MTLCAGPPEPRPKIPQDVRLWCETQEIDRHLGVQRRKVTEQVSRPRLDTLGALVRRITVDALTKTAGKHPRRSKQVFGRALVGLGVHAVVIISPLGRDDGSEPKAIAKLNEIAALRRQTIDSKTRRSRGRADTPVPELLAAFAAWGRDGLIVDGHARLMDQALSQIMTDRKAATASPSPLPASSPPHPTRNGAGRTPGHRCTRCRRHAPVANPTDSLTQGRKINMSALIRAPHYEVGAAFVEEHDGLGPCDWCAEPMERGDLVTWAPAGHVHALCADEEASQEIP